MANSKINTEETILRIPTDNPPPNADANSVRVYTDGTHVFSKDSSGTVVNLSTGGGGGGSSAGADRIIQLSDGSGGFSASGWEITNTDEDLNPSTHVNKQLGSKEKAVEKAYFGSGGIKLLKDNTITSSSTPAVADTDYVNIYTDNSDGRLYFKSIGVGSPAVHHYYMQDDDSSIELHLAGNSKYFTLKTPSGLSENQIVQLPTHKPRSNGQVLAVANLGAGDTFDLQWTSPATLIPLNTSTSFGYFVASSAAGNSPNLYEPFTLTTGLPNSFDVVPNGQTWTAGGSDGSHLLIKMWSPIDAVKTGTGTDTYAFNDDLLIPFQVNNGSQAKTDFFATNFKIKVTVTMVSGEGYGISATDEIYDHEFTSVSAVSEASTSNMAKLIISKADLNAETFGNTSGATQYQTAVIDIYVVNTGSDIDVTASTEVCKLYNSPNGWRTNTCLVMKSSST